MPSSGKRKTKTGMRGQQRNRNRNEFEPSPLLFRGEGSTQWFSAQYFRPNLHPIYQHLCGKSEVCMPVKSVLAAIFLWQRGKVIGSRTGLVEDACSHAQQ